MAEDLILKASLDTSEAEADAQKLKSSLAKVDGVSTSPNSGKALANNMNSARMASDAMFRSLQAMGGPIGRIAGMMKAFSDSARQLQAISSGTGGPGGTMHGGQALNAATNMGGGAIAGSSAGAAAAAASEGITELWENTRLWRKELHKQFKIDPEQFGPNPLAEIKKLSKQYAKIGAPLDPSKPNACAGYGSITTANGAVIGLDKLETASLGVGSRLSAFASKLGQAAFVVGTFAVAFKTGVDLQKKLYQTELQREEGRKASSEALLAWTKERAFGRIMQYGTEEQKRKVIESELGKTDEQLAAVNAWRASFDKEGDAGREERDAAIRKMESGGAKLERNWRGQVMYDSVEEWWVEQSKKKAGLKDTRLDLDAAKKAESKFTPKTPVTDELTRIGGSIGGGIDYQRSMANSLTSIDRAVAIIRASVTAKTTTYI